jgi:hypothetical protein
LDPGAVSDLGLALRVPSFVVITSALGLGAHAVAGGGPPSPGSAAMITVAVGIAGMLFALREQSLLKLLALVWAVQAWIHFVLLTGHRHGPGMQPLTGRLSDHHLHLSASLPGEPASATTTVAAVTARSLPADLPGPVPLAPTPPNDSHPLLILALHALAGALVAAWLRRGEAAVFRAARRILPRLLPRRRSLPVRRPYPTPLPVCTAPRASRGRPLIGLTIPRRGPPPQFV